MGRLIDLFVTYRFIKLLVTPFNKQDAYKNGLIDDKGYRTEKKVETPEEKASYTVLHKLIFNVKRLMGKVPGLGSRLGTYAAALFLLKDTFKESVDPKMFEREFLKFIKENDIKLDDTITEEVELVDGKLPKGVYKLSNDIIKDDDEEIPLLKKDDDVETLEDTLPSDTVLGVPVFAVLHTNSNSKIFVSMDDIEPVSVEDALGEI